MRCLLLVLALYGAAVLATEATPPYPIFPNDWTANEEDFAVVYQGQYSQQGNMYCCGDDNCEVQTEYQSGMNYFDYTHNRTRFSDPQQGTIVSLFYPIYKEMAVDNNLNCQSYCPIEEDLFPYALDDNSTFQGTKVVNGHTCNDWQGIQYLVGHSIVMEIDDVFVDTTTNLPVQEVDQLTPLGTPVGTETSTYHTFVPGTPSASLFAVKGIANCPEDQNCGQSFRQFVRRRWNLHETYLKYYQQERMRKSALLSKRTL